MKNKLVACDELIGKTVEAEGKTVKVIAAYKGIFRNRNSKKDGLVVTHIVHDQGTIQATEYKIIGG